LQLAISFPKLQSWSFISMNVLAEISCSIAVSKHVPFPFRLTTAVFQIVQKPRASIVTVWTPSDSLKYVPPSKCLTRLAEITAAKPPKEHASIDREVAKALGNKVRRKAEPLTRAHDGRNLRWRPTWPQMVRRSIYVAWPSGSNIAASRNAGNSWKIPPSFSLEKFTESQEMIVWKSDNLISTKKRKLQVQYRSLKPKSVRKLLGCPGS